MDKELKKLTRQELLEILINLTEENASLRQENDALKARNKEVEKELKKKKIDIKNSGSIAEAALKLSGIFQAAQKAVDIYYSNIRQEPDETTEELLQKLNQKYTPKK